MEEKDFAIYLNKERDSLRDRIAEETLHWWRKCGVINVNAEHYRAKERLMEYLHEIGV